MPRAFIATALFVLFSPPTPATQLAEEATEAEIVFAVKLLPLFAERCLACHGDEPDRLRGGFDMRSREAMLAGGETFGARSLVEGKAAESYLYLLTTRQEQDYEMPPKESEALSEEQQGWIRMWIDAGAPWPEQTTIARLRDLHAEGVTVTTSRALAPDWQNRRYDPADLWAYRPPLPTQIPPEIPHPIDHFIDAALAAAKLEPAPEAHPHLLLRRATFGLHGLPPTPAQSENFLAAWQADPPTAWQELIDQLLASPRYGEQWGRHWLDVVRYADSAGFANDYERPNAWRYRDYVIRAFNDDKPYDQFIREQIAGDEIDPADPEKLVATGFLRMGPWEHTAMSVARETRQFFLDDVTDSVGQVFLAHALQCARCHDHKFDPVPTRDYYAIQAVFATTQFAEPDAPWIPAENLEGMADDRALLLRRIEANEAVLAKLSARHTRYEANWFAERELPWTSRAEARAAGASDDKIPDGSLFRTAEEFGHDRIARKWKTRFNWELDRFRPLAFAVYNGHTPPARPVQGRLTRPDNPTAEGELEQVAILTGGDPFSPTDPVTPGVLSAVPGGLDYPIPDSIDGRRLALANWIADPSNPLAARTMVNRIWLHHFGQAIAANPNNFGATGKKPTHPLLLDWLALELVERGWSLKEMHRLIMTSATYRRSTRHPDPAALAEKDPGGILLAAFRPRRLAAEELRDAALLVSGELNLAVGGIPARPEMNLEAALQPRMIMGTFAPAYTPHPLPAQRHRRSIYVHKTRGQRDPFFEVFNQPSPDLSCEARDSSNITPQVFALFNSDQSLHRSLAFAERVLAETSAHPGAAAEASSRAVKHAFALAFGRPPSPDELSSALAHWENMHQRHQDLDFTPTEYPLMVIRRANEENTGQIFEFTEPLFAYENFQPDRQPHQLDPRARAFAELCLVLLNSNEFTYIY